jgi:hypothetical protein
VERAGRGLGRRGQAAVRVYEEAAFRGFNHKAGLSAVRGACPATREAPGSLVAGLSESGGFSVHEVSSTKRPPNVNFARRSLALKGPTRSESTRSGFSSVRGFNTCSVSTSNTGTSSGFSTVSGFDVPSGCSSTFSNHDATRSSSVPPTFCAGRRAGGEAPRSRGAGRIKTNIGAAAMRAFNTARGRAAAFHGRSRILPSAARGAP